MNSTYAKEPFTNLLLVEGPLPSLLHQSPDDPVQVNRGRSRSHSGHLGDGASIGQVQGGDGRGLIPSG